MIQNYSAFPNITLESASLEFMNHLITALQRIESRNTGRDLLKEINELCAPSTGENHQDTGYRQRLLDNSEHLRLRRQCN